MPKQILTIGELPNLSHSVQGNRFRAVTSQQAMSGPMGHIRKERGGSIAFLHNCPSQPPQCFLVLTRKQQAECLLIVMPDKDQVVIQLPR